MARRRNSSTLDDLLAISMKIPLWTNLLVAAAIFAGLRAYVGPDAPWSVREPAPQDLVALGQAAGWQVVKSAAYLAQFVLPAIFIIGGIIGWISRKFKAQKFSRISSAKDPGAAIRNLTWQEFEQMTGEAFRRKGYAVKETKKGPDGGIDLVLQMRGELFLVQCKHWRAQRVSVQVVRELYGVMAAQGAAGGYVVTSGAFTSDAIKFASGTNIKLIDGKRLTEWFAKKPNANR